ncbi:hypothetical protein ABLE92_17050 [Gordonia sp. VNQ95]|uniref:hypothetical protein n=1 Tax=Gordonia TaxID=2053 RepID=UPI0032B43D2E
MEPLYPILKNYDWNAKPFARYRNFLGVDRDPMPLIAYGYSEEATYRFLTSTDLTDRTVDDVHAEAMENLAAVEIGWESFDSTSLTASGHDFSAEKILDPQFITEAQQILGCSTIEVCVPRRRVIYATSATPGTREHQEFSGVVWHTWLDDSFGNAPITNMFFRFDGSQVVGATVLEPT